MRTRQIEVLQAILRTGSVSGAARLLHVSQPAVTRTLQHAEATVGFALFKRQGNRLVATPETNALAPMVERASSSLDAVRKLARNLKLGDDRPVRIAAVPSLAVALLPAAFARARRRMPQMRSELGSAHIDEITQKLLLHEIDIGVAFDPPPHPFMQTVELGELRLMAVGLPAALGKYARHKSISPEALSTMNLIEMSGKDPLGQIYARYAAHHQWPQGQTAVQSYHIGLRLAELGQGVAIIDSASALMCSDSLKVLPIEPAASFPVSALMLKDSAFTDVMTGVIKSLGEELKLRQEASSG
ncbi:MAG: LysR family transcriptional regulator [Burkholderiaceae bacterium]